jgi:hypothetical protein
LRLCARSLSLKELHAKHREHVSYGRRRPVLELPGSRMPSVQGRYSFAPPGLSDFPFLPTACAVGCILAPLPRLNLRRVAARIVGSGAPLIVKDRHYPTDNEFVFSLSNWKHGINDNSMQSAWEFGSRRVNVRRGASQ